MKPREIRDRCERIKSALLGKKFATEEEIAEHWPEPPEWGLRVSPNAYLSRHPNGDHAARARQVADWDEAYEWLICHGRMWQLWGERNALLRPNSEHAREKVMAGMLAQPRDVLLVSGEKVTVYPKSFDCLRFFSMHGWLVEFLGVRHDALKDAAERDEVDRERVPEPVSTIEAVQRAISHHEALLCWVATTPGPYLPWVEHGSMSERDAWEPTQPTPQEFYELNAVDVVFIGEAFQAVNFLPLHFLPRLSSKKRGSSEWDGLQSYFASKARRIGKSAKYLMVWEPYVSQIIEDTISSASIEEMMAR